jgi:hypothetical protein
MFLPDPNSHRASINLKLQPPTPFLRFRYSSFHLNKNALPIISSHSRSNHLLLHLCCSTDLTLLMVSRNPVAAEWRGRQFYQGLSRQEPFPLSRLHVWSLTLRPQQGRGHGIPCIAFSVRIPAFAGLLPPCRDQITQADRITLHQLDLPLAFFQMAASSTLPCLSTPTATT